MNGFSRGLSGMPPVVKNLIFINVLMLLAYYVVGSVFGIDMNRTLGLYFPLSEQFKPVQIVTHMFLHAGPGHLFFNMFALYMFGQVLEQVWGPKRFFIFYFVCGLGAALTHETVIAFQYYNLSQGISPENLKILLNNGTEFLDNGDINSIQSLYNLLQTPTVGASGAIFGVLLAFGVLFPNTQLMLLLPPVPIKAKYFVLIYGGIELVMAVTLPGATIAHAAHVGGMVFGYLLIRYWRKTTNTLY